jgi:hypothetical protein
MEVMATVVSARQPPAGPSFVKPPNILAPISQRAPALIAEATLMEQTRFERACVRGDEDLPPVLPSKDHIAVALETPEEEEVPASVPRLLHQTWKGCELLERQRGWWSRCARLSPRWDMRLWTDKANRAFLARHYPEHLPMYDGYSLNIKRVDAIRYFLLFHYGGVYMDADFACVRSLDTMPIRRQPGVATLILQRKKAIDEQAVSNAWMSAPPRHPFFALVISQLNASRDRTHVLDATGPRFLTRVWRAWNQNLFRANGANRKGIPVAVRGRTAFEWTVSMDLPPWALLHRVHSCRPSTMRGPPCNGPYNYAPCKNGKEAELDRCAVTMPNVSVTTFWTGTWVQDFYLHRGDLVNVSGKVMRKNKARAPSRPNTTVQAET